MPGQRKRKRHQEAEQERAAARFAPGVGRWVVVHETGDAAQWQEHIRHLRATDPGVDWSAVRFDVLCGRLVHPTRYRMSVFVPHAAPGAPGV